MDAPHAHEVLKFLEYELGDVKSGMLSGQNLMLHRITVYDRENWRDKLRAELPILKSRLGDKVGLLGDMRIVGLDEPYEVPDEAPIHPPKPETAVGRFGVHSVYRMTYQAYKITIMALVKA